jgi:hypothetical protein
MTQIELVSDEVAETEKVEAFELSLAELDLIGGGNMSSALS